MTPRFVSAQEAAALVPSGATVALTGSGGGVLEPHAVLAAIEERFLDTGQPRDLTVIHALGLGDGGSRGTNAFAHEGLVRRVIGGHWTWSPRMMKLAAEERIEAYSMPAGVISGLFRESGARRPGLFTRTGLRTFADPRLNGCRANDSAREPVVELVAFEGQEYLHYLPLRPDVAIVRGSVADEAGNIAADDEAALLDAFDAAAGARAQGGLVIAQVRALSPLPLDPRRVVLPATVVDLIVVAPDQLQTYAGEDGKLFVPVEPGVLPDHAWTDAARTLVAFRAADEVASGSVLNLGFGVSADVAPALAETGRLGQVELVIEQGLFGGVPATGDLFGSSRGPTARITSTNQFDLFAGGLIDVCCLGMAQVDRRGNVNVSRFGGRVVGPGGFVDISQNARKAVFCGTFTTRGIRIAVRDGAVDILGEGQIPKFVREVEEVTYSGELALEEGREAVYVTERAVFRATPQGLALVELAPGIDLERDVLAHMEFTPLVGEVQTMSDVLLDRVRRCLDRSGAPTTERQVQS